jgi:DNA-binding winged helix-turn-helix (wHTH) protein
VRRLRAKLGDAAWHIETVRSVGYRFRSEKPEGEEEDFDGEDMTDDEKVENHQKESA